MLTQPLRAPTAKILVTQVDAEQAFVAQPHKYKIFPCALLVETIIAHPGSKGEKQTPLLDGSMPKAHFIRSCRLEYIDMTIFTKYNLPHTPRSYSLFLSLLLNMSKYEQIRICPSSKGIFGASSLVSFSLLPYLTNSSHLAASNFNLCFLCTWALFSCTMA